MFDRRTFTGLLAGILAVPGTSSAQSKTGRVFFYDGIGPELTLYDINIDDVTLARQSSVMLPAKIQYVWPHPAANIIYAASSNGGPGIAGDLHRASALRIDPTTGASTSFGSAAVLRSRPIHLSVDPSGAYVLIAYNDPSGVSVHRINQDGTIGDEVKQTSTLDVGIFAHQIRVTPSGTMAVLVTRGNDAAGSKPEDPGALKVFTWKDGQLSNRASVAPGGGYGYGPRHLDFHPTQPFVYVSLERQNKLHVYHVDR